MKKSEIKPNIYLDYASTTPVDVAVLKEMIDCMQDSRLQGNPSSIHDMGIIAKQKIEKSRELISKILKISSNELIFTGSGTESDNLAILGLARANKEKGNHIIISSVEHKAVLESAKKLKEEGFKISYTPVDKNGMILIDELIKLIRKETILISIMYVNNEIGTIEPIKKISQKLKSIKNKNNNFPIFHTDACQASTILSVKPKELGVDAMSINSSKIYGPKGIGLLYIKKGIKIEPIIYGGNQEFGLRPGTENVALIAGFAKALSLVQNKYKKEYPRLNKIKNKLVIELQKIKNIKINSPKKSCSPTILNISFLGAEGESLLLELNNYGIYCSTGSACASRDIKPSHVLIAIGKSEEEAHTSIRFSFGKNTKESDIKYLIKILPKAVERIRKICAIN